jgi:hypothetical protein
MAQRTEIVFDDEQIELGDCGGLWCNSSTVGKWRVRLAQRGIDGLHDEPRPGNPHSIRDEDVERVTVKTLGEQPANATHWSTRSMAAATEVGEQAPGALELNFNGQRLTSFAAEVNLGGAADEGRLSSVYGKPLGGHTIAVADPGDLGVDSPVPGDDSAIDEQKIGDILLAIDYQLV